jgi:hypothetical protein
MSPEFEQIRSKRAFLVPLSVAIAAAISACGGGTKTETVHEPGQVRTIHETAKPHHKKHPGPTPLEQIEREIAEEEAQEAREETKVEAEVEAEGTLEAAPGGAEAPYESSHYSHGSHSSHSSHASHSSHVSSYGGEYGGGHVSHSSHSSHSSHYSSG